MILKLYLARHLDEFGYPHRNHADQLELQLESYCTFFVYVTGKTDGEIDPCCENFSFVCWPYGCEGRQWLGNLWIHPKKIPIRVPAQKCNRQHDHVNQQSKKFSASLSFLRWIAALLIVQNAKQKLEIERNRYVLWFQQGRE